jgi:hypothetical protein
LIDVVNPEVAKQIDEKKISLAAPNWDKLRELVIKITSKKDGTKLAVPTKIKLLKNSKSQEAVFPGFFASITKEGVVYIKNNFIGPKIAFSTYEIDRIKKEAGAQPTPAATFGGGFSLPGAAAPADFTEFTVEGL